MMLDRQKCAAYWHRRQQERCKPAISRDALAVGLIFLLGLVCAGVLAWLMSA